MIRILLVLLAVLVAVLAFVFDQPWLYAAAGVPLVGALGLLGGRLWDAYRRRNEAGGHAAPPSGEGGQEAMGVGDERPQERDGGQNGSPSSEKGAVGATEPTDESEAAPPLSSASPRVDPAEREPEPARRSESQPAAAVASDDRPVLGPFLESLRAALGAQTVCLLVQEEVVLEYRIEALASTETGAQRTGTFETQSPLLTATMSRQPVTVRRLSGTEERADLGYYDTRPAVDQVAVAPVEQPDSPSTVFLLADATAEVDLDSSRARALLERFAGTISLLRNADERATQAATDESPTTADEGSPASPDRADQPSEQPRPRREIIAEEMEAADAGNENLALVLVHLNRAESIARRGEEAVARAEQRFRTRLEHFAPGQRVERFGELTYGVFPRRGVDAVERWVADLQEAMDQETGELEGGVSVGVAVRGRRHDPEDLRADATRALQKAYETGTSTILE